MTPLATGSTIGILGGGQLGRMLAMAAARLGFDAAIYDPQTDSPAARVAALQFAGGWQDESTLKTFADACDVITLEFENVPVETLGLLERFGKSVQPGAASLATAQDRFLEKTFLNANGIATARFESVDGPGDIASALKSIGGHGVLKTRREGYDGKGQAWLTSAEQSEMAWHRLGDAPCILEEAIKFEREISVIVARAANGEAAAFAPPHNVHENGILARSTVPSGLAQLVEDEARSKAVRLAEALGHVGVLALEFFVLKDGTLLANEFAPRVHNSGHWTPEACFTGQFEQHIRCVTGWPLGSTRRLFDAEMVNLLGDQASLDPASLGEEDVLTLYGKRDARPGRKMGHITRRLGVSPPSPD